MAEPEFTPLTTPYGTVQVDTKNHRSAGLLADLVPCWAGSRRKLVFRPTRTTWLPGSINAAIGPVRDQHGVIHTALAWLWANVPPYDRCPTKANPRTDDAPLPFAAQRSANYGQFWHRYPDGSGNRWFDVGDPVRRGRGRQIGVVTTIYDHGPHGEPDVVDVLWPTGHSTVQSTYFLRSVKA